MRPGVKEYARRFLLSRGYVLSRAHAVPPDIDPATATTIEAVRPYTMTSPARVDALCQAVRYVVRNRVPGAIVECGVWRGGSMMAVARTLLEEQDPERWLYLFDTFEGMVPPGPVDRFRDGSPAAEIFRRESSNGSWCHAPLDQVEAALGSTGYPAANLRYVVGKVEQTLPREAPEKIAILRLDTDWYESTCHELATLHPRISPGGVLIIDDYGYWQGARKAVDEFFGALSPSPLLVRIDDSARLAVIPGPHP